MNELIARSATEIVHLLRERAISPVDAVKACAERIQQVDETINAMPTLCIEQAIEKAEALERQNPMGQPHVPTWLGGLADISQGLNRNSGGTHDIRFTDLPRLCPREIRHYGKAAGISGRDRDGQVQHTGIWRRRQHIQ